MSILDPACGSGSFLIGAYQKLLDWHRDWYVNDGPANHKARIYQANGDEWRLTTAERKRILLSHIYGVDIDPQAVEVTKLSLLLKVLEGENRETLQRQLKMFKERARPDLTSNIKCGNSLVGPDFYDGKQLDLFDEDELLQINVFDWHAEFPQIIQDGGFDAVIGNPPYIRIQNLREFSPAQAEYLKSTYHSASSGNFDIYVTFLERGLEQLNQNGLLGFIVPSKFLTTDYGAPIRNRIATSKQLRRLVDFGHGQVFPNVSTYTCLVFLCARSCDVLSYVRSEPEEFMLGQESIRAIDSASLTRSSWTFAEQAFEEIFSKLCRQSEDLLKLPAAMSRGTSSGADDVFCVKLDGSTVITKAGEFVEIESELLRRPIYATDFTRYQFRPENVSSNGVTG